MREKAPTRKATGQRRRLRSRTWVAVAVLTLGLAALFAFWISRRVRQVPPLCGSYEKCLQLGRGLRMERKFVRAEEAYQRALALNPGSFEAEFELGLLEEARARFDKAASHLKSAIALKPAAYAPYFELAKVLIKRGHFDEAREVFEKGRMRGDYTEVRRSYITEGYAGMHMRRPVQAENAFRRAIAVDPRDPMGYHHMGVFLLSRGKNREAESYFRKALSMDYGEKLTQRLDTFIYLIDLLWSQKRLREAEDSIKSALAYERRTRGRRVRDYGFHGKYLLYLEMTYEAEGDLSAAESVCWRAIGSRRVARSEMAGLFFAKLGEIYGGKGDLSAAERVYRRAVRSPHVGLPDKLRVLRRLSRLYAKEGRPVDAMKAAAEAKNVARDLLRKAPTYVRKGMFPKAEEAWTTLINLSSGTPPSLELAREESELIKVLRLEGRYGGAETWLMKLQALFMSLRRPQDAARAGQELDSLRREVGWGGPGRRAVSENLHRQTQDK